MFKPYINVFWFVFFFFIERIAYMQSLPLLPTFSRCIRTGQYPIRTSFENELAIDQVGVTREMFTAFWEECYSTSFDGATTLVPMVCPQSDMSICTATNRNYSFSWIYMVGGFLPITLITSGNSMYEGGAKIIGANRAGNRARTVN